MSGLDRLEDVFPHGTVAGYNAGCRGLICAGRSSVGWSCADAWVRFCGDWAFRKRVLAGWSPAEIAEADRAERVAERERARAARASTPRRPRSGGRAWSAADDERLLELYALPLHDSEIADAMGRSLGSVRERRRWLGLAAHAEPLVHGTRSGYNRGCRDDSCPASPSCIEAARLEWAAAKRRERVA